ncbi:MAG: hypothetical protein IH957_09480 [Chloroflexi bacterium]|nr:hypothetical protein [Chloroflexota bacterium]
MILGLRAVITLSTPVLLALLAAACSGGDDNSPRPTNAPGNLFDNPGLENGEEPWFTLKPDSGFTVTDEFAHSGTYSAYQNMDDPAEASGLGKVYYLVQEITPPEFPEIVEGFYRVENWRRGTPLQYLQFVIIALEPQNFDLSEVSNFQLRYIIAGVNAPPFDIGNAHFVFLSREDPVIGEWTHFSANVREDFQELWGLVPEDFTLLRLFFEVRWDGKSAGSGAPRADVYWDDLYIGDKSGVNQ